MSGHIVHDFKDLRKLIGQVTKDQPAKTQYQQQAEKMGYRPEAEAQPKDDKGDSGIARTLGKKHAGEEDIKKAYIKLGRAAQGSVQHQKKLVQLQLAKMGFKTYSSFAFDQLFKFESNQMIAKWLINEEDINEVSLDKNMLRKDFPNVWATKDNKLFRVLNTLIVMHGFVDNANSYKKDKKKFLDMLKTLAKSPAGQKRAGFGFKDMNYINNPGKSQKFWSATFQTPESVDESKMGALLIDIQQGATAKELAKDHDISIQVAKNFLSDYYGRKKSTKAPGLKKEAAVKEDIIIDNLSPEDHKEVFKALQKLEKRVGFEVSIWDESKGYKSPLYIDSIKDERKTKKAIEDTLKKLSIRNSKISWDESVKEVAGFKRPFGKITQADKDDAVDFLQSIKKNDPNAYKRLIKRLKLKDGVIPGLKEGKYLKYSDLLLKKSRLIDKSGPDSPVIKAINKEIEKEMRKLGIHQMDIAMGESRALSLDQIKKKFKKDIAKLGGNLPKYRSPLEMALLRHAFEKGLIKTDNPDHADHILDRLLDDMDENIQEGTWAVPDSTDKMKALNKLMKKSLIIKGDNDVKKASNTLGNIIGDDGVEDEWLKMASEFRKGSAAMDARDVIDKFLNDWGFTVKNHQITHYPVDILDEDDIQEKGNLKKPKKGKLLKLDNEPSRSQQVKEAYDHAKDSPFKLKSQQYPRAVAINNDGFGKRHATVEDIISACDSFGMILDKELQVEQIQKQLGKVGFISYKKSELEDIFHERETQRVILALESLAEEQEPIGYCQGEIAYAQLHEREIEFLKPDGQKAVGPVLKMSGNTYNVKDKFTGKSYTYKYTGETQVKSFKEVVNEGRFPSKLVKQAGGIAFDKRYYMGNMSGAIDAIEKLKKGLSDDPKVKEMLKIANEGVDEWVSKDGTRRRVKERDQRKFNKLKEWEDAIEASGDKEAYQKFFNKAMKKFGVSSPDELEGDKKKEFFDYVDKNWKGDHEEVEQDVHKSYRVDGRRKNFREKMKKLGYIKRY